MRPGPQAALHRACRLMQSKTDPLTLRVPRLDSSKRFDHSRAGSERSETLPLDPPLPFLWPQLESASSQCPYNLTSIPPRFTGLTSRINSGLCGLLNAYPVANRALNIGWAAMLLTRSVFPEKFIQGSLIGFEEFLKRLERREDARDLLTPEFAQYLYDYLQAQSTPDGLAEGVFVRSPQTGGGIKIRDAWIFIGNPAYMASSINQFGGLLEAENMNPDTLADLQSSKPASVLQLPFTTVVPFPSEEILGLEAQPGLQLAVDVEFHGTFKFGYDGEEMSQDRSTVVRFMSQAFGPQRCNTTEERNRRIFHIRDNIKWSIADIDYAWSKDNFVGDKVAS